jgi:UDP-hydrolysing UDP-N-acetyl-D-glucosamine 2-epimerase
MRTITVPVDSRANWTRAATVIEAIDAHPDLQCRFLACSKFAHEWASFTNRKPDNVLATYQPLYDTPIAMAHSSALLMDALADCWRSEKPDVVLALTDRYETLAVATTAALMNINIAHIQGGEVTGTIDESLRHAVTKLAHIHFPATEDAATNICSLGENPEFVYNVGCPATDLLLRVGVTQRIITQPYILVLLHPVTTEYESSYQQMSQVLKWVSESWDGLVVVVGPNHDAGNYGIWQAIKEANVAAPSMIPHAEFVNLMAHASVFVGNSSAGIREACYFGTPVVDVGTRQKGRIPRCQNVVSDYPSAIKDQLRFGRYEPEQLYGTGASGVAIADLLATMNLPPVQKRLYGRD